MPPILTRLDSSPDLVDLVYRRLLDAICAGQLEAGTRLTQEEIAEQLNVSRQPVLQALRQLKADALVQDAPGLHGSKGRGVQVAPLQVALIGHIYQLRSELDALAASLAAEHGARIDPELIRQGREATASGDVTAMLHADVAFHRAIYQASGNPLIESAAFQHWCHIRRAMGETLRRTSLRANVWDEHAAMAAAIAAQDAVTAARLAREHCQQASDNLTRHLSAPPDAAQVPLLNSVVR